MSEEIQLEIDQGLLKGFIDEALESLAEIDSLLVQLEGDPENLDLINSIFRPVHSI